MVIYTQWWKFWRKKIILLFFQGDVDETLANLGPPQPQLPGKKKKAFRKKKKKKKLRPQGGGTREPWGSPTSVSTMMTSRNACVPISAGSHVHSQSVQLIPVHKLENYREHTDLISWTITLISPGRDYDVFFFFFCPYPGLKSQQ